RNYYGSEPLFENSKIVTSIFSKGFEGIMGEKTLDKVSFDAIEEDAIADLEKPDYYHLMQVAIQNSDAVIIGSENIPTELNEYIDSLSKPVLKYHKVEDFSQAYLDFYRDKVLN